MNARAPFDASVWLSIILSRYRDFKTFYQVQVRQHWKHAFSHAVSYNRFIELTPCVLVPLDAYLRACMGSCTGISFLDSTALAVCQFTYL